MLLLYPKLQNRTMSTGKLILNVVLIIGVLALTFLLYKSIEEPITVDNARSKRQPATHARLLEIKKAQMAYLESKGKFASSFDSLLYALKNDSVAEIKIVGNPDLLEEDSTAVVLYDTTYISLLARAYNNPDYNVDSLPYVPFTGGKTFNIEAKTIDEGGQKVPVFEVSVTEKVMLHDQVQKYVSKDVVWKIGSLLEARYDGNWE